MGVIVSCGKEPSCIIEGDVPLVFSAVDIWDVPSKAGEDPGSVTEREDLEWNDFSVFAEYHPWNGGPSGRFMWNQKIEREDSESAWTYSPVKYWPEMEGDRLSFRAYAPSVGNDNIRTASDGVLYATLPLSGVRDVLLAYEVSGIAGGTSTKLNPGEEITYSQGMDGISFNFRHLLQRVRFQFIQGEGFADGYQVDHLTATEQPSSVVLNVHTGELDFSASQNVTYLLGGGQTPYPIQRYEYASTVDDAMYLPPTTGSLKVVADIGGDLQDATITLPDPAAGKSYLVRLYFIGTEIVVIVKDTFWEDVNGANGPVVGPDIM